MSYLPNPTQARFLGRYLTQARGEHQPRRLAPHQLNPLRGGRQGAAGTVARLIQGRRRPGALVVGVAQGRGSACCCACGVAGRAEEAGVALLVAVREERLGLRRRLGCSPSEEAGVRAELLFVVSPEKKSGCPEKKRQPSYEKKEGPGWATKGTKASLGFWVWERWRWGGRRGSCREDEAAVD